jgi:hypothetical protein
VVVDGTTFTSFGNGTRYAMSVNRAGVAVAKQITETSTSRINYVMGAFISDPLDAQTIAGTFKGQARLSETLVGADFHVLTNLRVEKPNETLRGLLHAHATPAGTTVSGTPGTDTYEIDAAAHTNRKLPAGWSGSGASLSSVDAQKGDVLVFTVGVRAINTVSTSYTANLLVSSDAGASDLAQDETATADAWPWIEFSQDLVFLKTPDPLMNLPENRLTYALTTAARPAQVWPRGAGQ